MAPVEINFFAGEVRVCGQAVRLPAKEMALLFTVAAVGPLGGTQLMDMLWPDADGDAAHNAFRVCLHRLRKHLNRGPVIVRTGRAYALDSEITVDLYQLRNADADVDGAIVAIRRGHASRAALGEWFEPFERLLWGYVHRCRRGRASDLVTVL
jgi:DNA-binding SARP family transcriptional activator